MNKFMLKMAVLEKENEQLKKILNKLYYNYEMIEDITEEHKLNCQLSQELRKKFEKYRINNTYCLPRIKLKNGFILRDVTLFFLDNFEILISSRDFNYNGYIYDIILED